MKGVEIIDLRLVKDDHRGITFEFDNRQVSKMLLLKRKQGSISGGHYHTGANKLKDPETILLIDGTAEFIFKDVKTGDEQKEKISKPAMIKIAPYIKHTIIALTDIILIDMNSIKDDDDTIKDK